MTSLRSMLAAAVFLGLSTAGVASADVPGPRHVCDVDGLGCESCWQHYGTSPADVSAFEACRDGHVAKGLVEACRNRQGAGDTVWFCPEGVRAGKVTKGGGCGGCSVGEGGVTGALAALGLGIGLAALRRRKTR